MNKRLMLSSIEIVLRPHYILMMLRAVPLSLFQSNNSITTAIRNVREKTTKGCHQQNRWSIRR